MGLKISSGKIKTMVFGKEKIEKEIHVGDTIIENVKEFTYLGSMLTWDNDHTREIKLRVDKAKVVIVEFKDILKSKEIKPSPKIRLLKTCVFSVALYASETWTLKKTDRDKILAFEMYCYRWILQIRRTQKIRNAEIRNRLNIREDLIQEKMRKMLSLFGHITRIDDSRKIKKIMVGIMDGANRRARPCREWIDDMTEWCQ